MIIGVTHQLLGTGLWGSSG